MEGGGSDGGRGAGNRSGLRHVVERDDDEISLCACSVTSLCSDFAIASPSSSCFAASSVASMPLDSLASMAATASLSVGDGNPHDAVDNRDGERERGGCDGDGGCDFGGSSSNFHNRSVNAACSVEE